MTMPPIPRDDTVRQQRHDATRLLLVRDIERAQTALIEAVERGARSEVVQRLQRRVAQRRTVLTHHDARAQQLGATPATGAR